MQTHKKLKARILSLALSAAMVFTMMPATVFATEGDVPLGASSITECHPAHDEDCGYLEAVEGVACSHLNEDGTYSCAPALDSGDVSGNAASPSDAEKEYVCDHADGCGYAEAIEGTPCTHECEQCKVQDSGKPEDKPRHLIPCLDEDKAYEYLKTLITSDIASLTEEQKAVLDEHRAVCAICDGILIALTPMPLAGNDAAALQSIINAASDGGTITLDGDYAFAASTTVSISKNLTIDLNGKTISHGGGPNSGTITVTGSANLTIAGTGTLTSSGTSTNSYLIQNSGTGTVTIEGGTLVGSTENLRNIRNSSTGAIVINGGTLQTSETAMACRAIQNESGGTITINGGTLTGGGYVIDNGTLSTNATINMNGGTIKSLFASTGYGLVNQGNNCTINVSGGTISAVTANNGVKCFKTTTVNFTGGSISGVAGATPKGVGGAEIAKYTFTLKDSGCSTASSVAVASLALTPEYTYGMDDVMTDANGKIYIWLPSSAQTTAATATVSSSAGAASGTYESGSTAITGKTADLIKQGYSFSTLTANGTANTTDTTELTLTFDKDVTGLAATDITVTGATKGTLTKETGTGVYKLTISNITVAEGANVNIAVAKTGFTFNPTNMDVAVHKAPSGGLNHDISSGTLTMEAAPGGTTGCKDGCSQSNQHIVTGTGNGAIAAESGTHYVMLNGVSIETTQWPINISLNSTIYLSLMDGTTNTLKSTMYSGIKLLSSSTLFIDGNTGILNATGGDFMYGAGIGGDDGGNITIRGGVINATGGSSAAGIGGGSRSKTSGSSAGNITISGGTVTAIGKNGGAGIGGGGGTQGQGGAGGTINISGGIINATGGTDGGAGIGGGAGSSAYSGGNGGTVTISKGTVTATGGSMGGVGIGGGSSGASYAEGGAGGNITISGGTVTATGGTGGTGATCSVGIGIGTKNKGQSDSTAPATLSGTTVTVSGGTVITTGKSKAVNTGTLTLTGTAAKYKVSGAYTGATNINSNKIYEGADQTTEAKDVKVTVAATDVAVAFNTLTANGTANTTDTTELTLTFDQDVTDLTADDITVTGATKGTLTKQSGTGIYKLAISNITVAEGANVNVAVAKTGFTFTPANKDVAVHKAAGGGLNHNIGTDGPLTLTSGDSCSVSSPHVITGATATDTTTDVVTANSGTHYVTLDNVTIDAKKADGPFAINAGTVNLTLKADTTNTLTAKATQNGEAYAGLYVASGATLVIDGTGSLIATGSKDSMMGVYGAGIGGSSPSANRDAGTITIKGGTVTASGVYGIGGGASGSSKGTASGVTISGTNTVVTATGFPAAAAVAATTLTLTGMEAKYKVNTAYTGATNISSNKIYEGTTQTTEAKDVKITADASSSTITPTTATFDKYTSATGYADVVVTQTLNGNTLIAIKNGTTTLTANTHYTVSGNTITIKKEYLAQQAVGTTTLTFDYSAGTDPTLAITVSDAPTTHTITASAGTGGSISPSGTVTVNNGESKTFAISANSNYSISSVSVDGANQGAISTYTFSNVTGNHTISATFSYNGGGSSGGGGSSSGGSSSTPPSGGSAGGVSTPGKTVIDNPVGNQGSKNTLAEAVKNAIATGTTNPTVYTNFANYTALTKDGLKAINDATAAAVAGKNVQLSTKVQLDNKVDNVVVSRITVDPVKLATVMPDKLGLGVWFDQKQDKQVTAVKEKFERAFDNNMVIVTFEQKDPLKVDMEFAAKPDLSKLNTKTLYFYSYNPTTNLYYRILSPNYWVDKNGYTHFTAPFGGSVVISDKPLTKK